MSVIQAILLGMVQGITEFLPVSSSAHLILFRKLLQVENTEIVLFSVLLHCGSLIAILLAFSRDIRRLLLATCGILLDVIHNLRQLLFGGAGRRGDEKRSSGYRKLLGTNYRRMALSLLITMIPTALIGYAVQELVELMSANLLAPGVGLYLTTIMLMVADMLPEGQKKPKNLKAQDALFAGIFQGFSALPGLSRLGTTISACVIGGMSRSFAVKYSMLASVPTILGSLILELTKLQDGSVAFSPVYLAGIPVSAIVGIFMIRLLLRLVRSRKLKYFALYCLIAGTLMVAGHFIL